MEKGASGPTQGPQKPCKGDGKQINSMLKVIPPKVYITDSSSFKRLVQELTGNGTHATSSPSSSSSPPMQELHDYVPVISIEDYGEPELCSFEGQQMHGEVQLPADSQAPFGFPALSPLAAFTALQTAWTAQQMDEFQYQELDTWSTELDQLPFYDSCTFPTEEELFFSQYDISELYSIL